MIVIRAELHHARTGVVEVLGTAVIHNVGGDDEHGDYHVKLANPNHPDDLRRLFTDPHRRGSVVAYPRKRYWNQIWRLVLRGLQSALPEESVPCDHVQHGDLTECVTCGLRWDTNDPAPPRCKELPR